MLNYRFSLVIKFSQKMQIFLLKVLTQCSRMFFHNFGSSKRLVWQSNSCANFNKRVLTGNHHDTGLNLDLMWDSWYNYVRMTMTMLEWPEMLQHISTWGAAGGALNLEILFCLIEPLGLWSVERCRSNHVLFHSTFSYEGSYQYWVVLEWFQLKNGSSPVPHIMDPPTQFQVPFLKKQIPIPRPQWTSTHQCTI